MTKHPDEKPISIAKTAPANDTSKVIVNQGKGGSVFLFPTVCFIKPHKDTEAMNKALEAFALKQEKEEAGLRKSSIKGGYHSSRQFFESDNEAVQQLKQLIHKDSLEYMRDFWKSESNIPLESVGSIRMKMNGWSVILREGDVSVPHIHPRANISGVYYATSVKDDPNIMSGAGNLVLADPRVRAGVAPIRNQASNVMIPPRAGTMVMFPSYMEHYVLPFKGKGHRISIAFNLTFAPNALSSDS